MQPYVFPYIGYFQLIRDADLFVVFDDVNFRKRSWINRNRILLNDTDHLFSLHLYKASSSKKINEIEVGDNAQTLLKTFRQAYSHAPYYSMVMPLIEDLILYKEKQLAIYLMYQLQSISRYLGLHTRFVLSSAITKDNNLRSQDKILAICEALGANAYSNAIGGQHLYDERDFAEQGIDLKFIQTDYIEYRQFGAKFIPWLSIIDVMMFNSTSQIRTMLDAYQLVSTATLV
jgi:hypothetical protein